MQTPMPPDETKRPQKSSGSLRGHFLSGLAVGAPIVLTLWLVWSAIVMIDGWIMPFIPRSSVSAESLLRQVPGVGVAIFLFATVVLGILAKGVIGRTAVRLGEALMARVPVVRTIYGSIKQIMETVLGQDGPKFQKACLVQYPHPGCWAIAFVSSNAKGEISTRLSGGDRIVSLFLPTTPNPTSGFLLFAKESEVIYLDMGVDDAVKLIISAGLVYPGAVPAGVPAAQAAP